MIKKIIEPLKPYADVIIFMVTLLVVNYAWKYTVTGDENGDAVTWFGLDITAPFEFMACHIASAVYWVVSLFRDTVHMVGDHSIRFDSGSGTTIIACEQLERVCYAMERSPEYCDLAVKRWEEFTGQKAERITKTEEKTDV